METIKITKSEFTDIPNRTIVVRKVVKEWRITAYEDNKLVYKNLVRRKRYPHYHVNKVKEKFPDFEVKSNIKIPSIPIYKSPPLKFISE